jgi:DNA-binding beta-propeller fold protein YncE
VTVCPADVYVPDTSNKRVVEALAAGWTRTLGTGLNNPLGVALDSSNNLFIADNGNQRVIEISALTVASGIGSLQAVAVDPGENLIIAPLGIEELPASGGSGFLPAGT